MASGLGLSGSSPETHLSPEGLLRDPGVLRPGRGLLPGAHIGIDDSDRKPTRDPPSPPVRRDGLVRTHPGQRVAVPQPRHRPPLVGRSAVGSSPASAQAPSGTISSGRPNLPVPPRPSQGCSPRPRSIPRLRPRTRRAAADRHSRRSLTSRRTPCLQARWDDCHRGRRVRPTSSNCCVMDCPGAGCR